MGSRGYTYFIFLMIGLSVSGVVSTLITTGLGFPFWWSSAISFGLLGGAFFLFYKNYPPQAWILGICLVFICFASMALLRSVIIQEPDIPDGYSDYLETQEQTSVWLPPEFVSEIGYGFDDKQVAPDEERTIIETYSQEPYLLNIQFEPIETLEGQWAFIAGHLTLRGGVNATINADPTQNWLNAEDITFIVDENSPDVPIEPYLKIEIPIGRAYGEEILITAELDMLVPTRENPQGERQTLTRTFRALVADGNFYNYQLKFAEWQRAKRVTRVPMLPFLVLGSVGCAGLAVVMVRQNALHPRPTSGLIVEVRRQNGLQRLGVEAYTVDKIETTAETGAVLGMVKAQSPAGRGGLRSGDVVLQFDGKAVKSPRDLNRYAGKFKRGETSVAQVLRDNQILEIPIRF